MTTLAALGFLAWSGVKDGRRQPLAAVWALPVTSPALGRWSPRMQCIPALHARDFSKCFYVLGLLSGAPLGLDSAATWYFSPLLGDRTVVPIIQEIMSLDGWATSQWPASRYVLSP